MENYSKKMSNDEKMVADKVADEILVFEGEKDDKRYFVLVLFLLLCLIFLVSSLSFAVFDTYYNGSSDNVIDVTIDVDDDDDDKPSKPDKPDTPDKPKPEEPVKPGDDKEDDDNDEDNKPSKPEEPGVIAPGSVLFSFNEGSNYISMGNVLPTSDQVGMNLNGDKEFFDFNISSKLKGSKKGKLVYEVAIVPVAGNTIDENDVRVYLTENGNGVSILNDKVNTFTELPDSKYHDGAKVIYKKEVSDKFDGNYVFRMWLSSKAKVDKVSKIFACKIVVDAYYK